MKRVAVVGAGVIGVTTAWYLREHGFEVTVYERRGGVALGTSAANAGIIAPGYVTPWAAPGMPAKLASYLTRAESPIIFRPSADAAQWRWIASWLRAMHDRALPAQPRAHAASRALQPGAVAYPARANGYRGPGQPRLPAVVPHRSRIST